MVKLSFPLVLFACCASLVTMACVSRAAEPAEGAAPVDYQTRIKPLLREKCYSCHGVLRQEASLRLETRTLMLDGGVIEPGDAEASLIIERVTAEGDMRMPPEGEGTALTAEELRLLAGWINQGANAPDEPVPSGPEEHWAFQPITRPPLPVATEAVAEGAAGVNPVDAFLDAARGARNLTPVDPAPPRVLLRRLYLDLVGVPPSREALREFEADPSEGAYRRVVDSLLASPQYGERWGRHWMDVWRYSDWYGLGEQLRNSAQHIWQWRDWIVESLNADKGYDRMVVEMLAADEIAPEDPDALRATGYLARHYYLFNRTTWMDDVIEHTSQAFLGLTMQCAKCHAHKYDPISHEDYYRMRAFFEPYQVRVDSVPGETDLDRLGLARVFDAHPDAPTFLHLRGDPKQPDDDPLAPGVPEILGGPELAIEPVELPLTAYRPRLRPHVIDDHRRDAMAKIEAAERELANARMQLQRAQSDSALEAAEGQEGKAPEDPLAAAQQAVAVAEKSLEIARLYLPALEMAHAADAANAQSPPPAELAESIDAANLAFRQYELAKAELGVLTAKDESAKTGAEAAVENARVALEQRQAGYLRITASLKALEGPDETDESRRAPYPSTSTGRRSALARWIVHRDNPLTARVAVNHIWMRHFGQPLVDPVTDFGLRTPAPPLQSLLDWLAADFMDHGWSMKHLHRQIVTSRAYRLSSTSRDAAPETIAADPANHFYWRRVPRRMESQVVRDSLLSLAGQLDTTMGGPPLPPNGKEGFGRRSLYFRHSRDDQNPFLAMFDDADILRCYRRSETVVPQQALAMANSSIGLEAAKQIADRIASQPGSPDDEFATAAFETVLAVRPTAEELELCLDAMRRTREALDDHSPEEAQRRSRQNLVHALLNHNDFITIR